MLKALGLVGWFAVAGFFVGDFWAVDPVMTLVGAFACVYTGIRQAME
jgi:hypothetical protein